MNTWLILVVACPLLPNVKLWISKCTTTERDPILIYHLENNFVTLTKCSDAQPLVNLKENCPRKRIEKRQILRHSLWILAFVIWIRGQKVLSFCQIYFSCNKGVPESDRNVFITQRNNYDIWARIYTTNVGTHRLLHDILRFLIILIRAIVFHILPVVERRNIWKVWVKVAIYLGYIV